MSFSIFDGKNEEQERGGIPSQYSSSMIVMTRSVIAGSARVRRCRSIVERLVGEHSFSLLEVAALPNSQSRSGQIQFAPFAVRVTAQYCSLFKSSWRKKRRLSGGQE
jgi:hypothetical protein